MPATPSSIGTTPSVTSVDVATLSNGDYIVAWKSSNSNISFQRFDSNGVALSSVIQTPNPSNTSGTHVPCVMPLDNGGFIISKYYDNGNRGFVYSVYSPQNTLVKGPLLVGDAGWSYASEAGLRNAAYANGYVISASHSESGGTGGNSDEGAWDVNLYLKDLNGNTIFSGKAAANNFGAQINPEITTLSDGASVLITWSDKSGILDNSGFGIYGRVFSTTSKSFTTGTFLINQITSGSQGGWNGAVSTVSLPGGGFATFWVNDVNAGAYRATISAGQIEGRIFSLVNGVYQASSNEFRLSNISSGNQNFLHASVTPDGHILTIFSVVDSQGVTSIVGKELSETGLVLKSDFVISTNADSLSQPDISWLSDGSAVAVWTKDNTATATSGDRIVVSQIIPASTLSANAAPLITSNGGGNVAAVNVSENTTAVTTVKATDSDANTTLTYSISGGADAALFQIDASTGALNFKSAPNFENPTDAGANNVYNVTVEASDGSLKDSQSISVTVVNVNEAPSFGRESLIGADNQGSNFPVHGEMAGEFLSGISGVIYFQYAYRGDSPEIYKAYYQNVDTSLYTEWSNWTQGVDITNFVSVERQAGSQDNTIIHISPDAGISTSEILVNVDGGIWPWMGVSLVVGGYISSVSVTENTTAVTTVNAVDPDANTTLTYSVSGGADAALFQINATTGVLSFKTAPSFEAPADSNHDNIYDVIVQVSDGTLTDTQAFTVTVTNTNSAPTITSRGGGDAAFIRIAENTSTVATVMASDPDDNTTLTFSIAGGSDGALFQIDASTGALTFKSAPDYEAPGDANRDNVYNVIVQVSDGALTDTQALAVTVSNVAGVTVFGTSGSDTITPLVTVAGQAKPTSEDDFLLGGSGNDILDGGLGNDALIGDFGVDTFRVTAGTDSIADLGRGGADILNVTAGATANATISTAWTASPMTVNKGTANITTNGLAVNLAAVTDASTGNFGYRVTNTGSATTLTGSVLADWLTGGTGNDFLTGGAGIDALNGGDGADLYIIANPTDHPAAEIVDSGTSGIDEVRFTSTVAGTLTLYAGDLGIEKAVIGTGTSATASTLGSTANNIDASRLGYGLTLIGNAGANVLTGGAGNDVLTGNSGIDTFRVTAGRDTVTDLGNGGADILNVSTGATVNATIAAAWTASSSTVNQGTANITTSGKAVNLGAITSTAAGNKGFTVTNTGAATTLTGSALNDWLTGGTGNDTLLGGSGNDQLRGGLGKDNLTGGAGADQFVFDKAPNSSTNLDTITDFASGTDKLVFSKAVFTGLSGAALGNLSADAFWAGPGVSSAHDATDRFAYDTTSGYLYYDADGIGGAAAVQVALLGVTTHPAISYSDIMVI